MTNHNITKNKTDLGVSLCCDEKDITLKMQPSDFLKSVYLDSNDGEATRKIQCETFSKTSDLTHSKNVIEKKEKKSKQRKGKMRELF